MAWCGLVIKQTMNKMLPVLELNKITILFYLLNKMQLRYHSSSSLSRTSPVLYTLLCLHWHCSWGIQPLSEISSKTVPTKRNHIIISNKLCTKYNFLSCDKFAYRLGCQCICSVHWPGGQKQPSILCSAHNELVSVFVHVSRQGEPLSEYSMLKGQVIAKWVTQAIWRVQVTVVRVETVLELA